MTLSGIFSLQQLKDNISMFEVDRPWIPVNWRAWRLRRDRSAVYSLYRLSLLRCTVPQELNIPHLLEICNERLLEGSEYGINTQLALLPEGGRPTGCTGCRSCEKVCPQGISIADVFKRFNEIGSKA